MHHIDQYHQAPQLVASLHNFRWSGNNNDNTPAVILIWQFGDFGLDCQI